MLKSIWQYIKVFELSVDGFMTGKYRTRKFVIVMIETVDTAGATVSFVT